jgi:hypothetical protein
MIGALNILLMPLRRFLGSRSTRLGSVRLVSATILVHPTVRILDSPFFERVNFN